MRRLYIYVCAYIYIRRGEKRLAPEATGKDHPPYRTAEGRSQEEDQEGLAGEEEGRRQGPGK